MARDSSNFKISKRNEEKKKFVLKRSFKYLIKEFFKEKYKKLIFLKHRDLDNCQEQEKKLFDSDDKLDRDYIVENDKAEKSLTGI